MWKKVILYILSRGGEFWCVWNCNTILNPIGNSVNCNTILNPIGDSVQNNLSSQIFVCSFFSLKIDIKTLKSYHPYNSVRQTLISTLNIRRVPMRHLSIQDSSVDLKWKQKTNRTYAFLYPSILHTTLASLTSKFVPQTVPHILSWRTSTLPSVSDEPLDKRTWMSFVNNSKKLYNMLCVDNQLQKFRNLMILML